MKGGGFGTIISVYDTKGGVFVMTVSAYDVKRGGLVGLRVHMI